MSMSWRHLSFSLPKKQKQPPIFLFKKKKGRKCFTDVKSAFPSLITAYISHIKSGLRRLSTHPCINRNKIFSGKVPRQILPLSVRGASLIQPTLEPIDHSLWKIIPTWKLFQPTWWHTISKWNIVRINYEGQWRNLVKDFYLGFPVYLLFLMHSALHNSI